MFVEGSKAIYCLGETEEIVDIVKVHPDSITIFVPSIQRERDTLPEKLRMIEEEKKIVLELPEKEPFYVGEFINIKQISLCDIRKTNRRNCPEYMIENDNILVLNPSTCSEQRVPINAEIILTYLCTPPKIIPDLYKEVVNLENRDKVLMDNQKILMEQVNSLQETVKSLKKRDEERETELWTLLKMHKEQKMIHELELKELRKLLNK
jgi:hypothetical protein